MPTFVGNENNAFVRSVKTRVRKLYFHEQGKKPKPYKWFAECDHCGWTALSWAWVRAFEETDDMSAQESHATTHDHMMSSGGAYSMALEHQYLCHRAGGKPSDSGVVDVDNIVCN